MIPTLKGIGITISHGPCERCQKDTSGSEYHDRKSRFMCERCQDIISKENHENSVIYDRNHPLVCSNCGKSFYYFKENGNEHFGHDTYCPDCGAYYL